MSDPYPSTTATAVGHRHLQVVPRTLPGDPTSPYSWAARLSRRESDVLALLAEGQSTNEIASTLFISPATVKCHVARLIAKVGARDRVQLVIAAYRSGFVSVD